MVIQFILIAVAVVLFVFFIRSSLPTEWTSSGLRCALNHCSVGLQFPRASKVKWWGDELTLTASFGGTTVRNGDTMATIVERAEQALAESVTSGGDCSTIIA